MKTYLVTGGAGFIGSTLVERLLREGNRVVVIDNFNDFYDPGLKEANIRPFLSNPNFRLVRGDIRDTQAVEEAFQGFGNAEGKNHGGGLVSGSVLTDGAHKDEVCNGKIDAVMHLAAMAGVRPSIEKPALYQDVNGMGTQNILEAARRHGVSKLVLASSSSVYGNCKEVPFREDMTVDFAISPYAATKKGNEVMAHVYHHLFKMDIVMLRFFTVYGPKQRPDLAINKFARLMAKGKEIPMYGDGLTSRDYTYVDDIVEGICRTFGYLEKNSGVYEIINLGSKNPISLREMIETVGRVMGVKPKIREMPMQPGDVERTFADISKAERLLGYAPSVSFEEGVRRFMEWSRGR